MKSRSAFLDPELFFPRLAVSLTLCLGVLLLILLSPLWLPPYLICYCVERVVHHYGGEMPWE
jgi:hypothetical protein